MCCGVSAVGRGPTETLLVTSGSTRDGGCLPDAVQYVDFATASRGADLVAMDDIRRRFDHVRYRQHAIGRLRERGITVAEVRNAVAAESAEIIDAGLTRYGPVSLVLGWRADGRPLHILFGTGDILWVITAYDPSADPKRSFEPPDYRVRRSGGSGQRSSHG